MATKKDIINAIKKRVTNSKTVNYPSWRIGITQNITDRKTYWKDTKKLSIKYWKQWQTDSLEDAQDAEDYFINEYPEGDEDKRMKGGTGGDLNKNKTTYVYIF